MKIEICVDHPAAALTAVQCGADRLELCSALSLGGLTPSHGFMHWCRANIQIPVHVMIRPRMGNFLYSTQEMEIMKEDLLFAKDLGYDGIVFGILNNVNDPDVIRIKEIIELAKPMTTTFHRAFDVCREPIATMEMLINCGIDVILTSGGKEKAIDGALLIADLVKKATGRITILPGSGITDKNIEKIASVTGASWFHLSARISQPGHSIADNRVIIKNAVEGLVHSDIDGDMIKKIKNFLK